MPFDWVQQKLTASMVYNARQGKPARLAKSPISATLLKRFPWRLVLTSVVVWVPHPIALSIAYCNISSVSGYVTKDACCCASAALNDH
jgi:hypothetical protein